MLTRVDSLVTILSVFNILRERVSVEKKEFLKKVERIYCHLENPIFAQEEKKKMYIEVLQLFGQLSSKDRQDYLKEEGDKGNPSYVFF